MLCRQAKADAGGDRAEQREPHAATADAGYQRVEAAASAAAVAIGLHIEASFDILKAQFKFVDLGL